MPTPPRAQTQDVSKLPADERDAVVREPISQWKQLATRRYLPTPRNSIFILRGMVALIFMAHALVRLVNGSVPQFGAFLEARGFPFGFALVLLISAYEIIGGLMLALGIHVKRVCAGLAVIALVGIVLIHWNLGWFVGEHGTGGMEFSWLLAAALLVLAASDDGHRDLELSNTAGQNDKAAPMLDSTPRR